MNHVDEQRATGGCMHAGEERAGARGLLFLQIETGGVRKPDECCEHPGKAEPGHHQEFCWRVNVIV